jgi:ketosteroid isomerase-like protein
MGRAAGDVFRDHLSAVNSGDIQTILMDYAEDAQILTAQGALKGREGVEAFYTQAFSLLPGAQIVVKQTVAGENSLLVWWSASSSAGRIDDGIDTFVIEDGLIVLQTPTFTVQPSAPG